MTNRKQCLSFGYAILLTLHCRPLHADEPSQTPDSQASDAQPAPSSYEGPSVLSRAGAAHFFSAPSVSFRPYVGVMGSIDSGLTGLSLDKNGNLQKVSSYGVQGSLGLYGGHQWRHTSLDLDYRGQYYHFPGNSVFDGIDQYLNLTLAHRLTRRITLELRESAGTSKRNYGLGGIGGIGYYDPVLLGVSPTSLFDNRVDTFATVGALTYRRTSRLSFNFSGGGVLMRRQSSALYGSTGYTASADAVYRVTKYVSFGVEYSFMHYEFLRTFGAFDANSAGVNAAFRLSRSVELSLRGGAYRMESLLVALVPVDPVIAAITGQTAGIVASYQKHYFPLAGARLSYGTRHSTMALNASASVSAGNGVVLSARQDAVMAMYTYTGVRHWNVGATASYERLSSSFQNVGKYDDYSAGVGITRDITNSLHGVLRGDVRRFSLGSLGLASDFKGTQYRVSLGFDFSPGDVPLHLW